VRLGLVTRYCHHEATYAATRIADWATQAGLEVSLFSTTPNPPRLGRWDAAVQCNLKQSFTNWVKTVDYVLWMHTPAFEQVQWATGHGRSTVIFCVWHELTGEARKAYREAGAIICPSNACAQFIRDRWQLRNVFAAPYDPGLPLTQKASVPDDGSVKMLLPLFDQSPHTTESTGLEMAGRMLCQFAHTQLTVAYNTSTLAPFAKRRIRQFAKAFPGRVRLVAGCALRDRPVLLSQHDILFWPTHAESTGHVGLSSLAMGTPVVAFNFPPISEFLDESNAVVVPCRTAPNDLGVPIPVPNYPAFEICCQHLLREQGQLRQLQRSVHSGLAERQTVFHEVLRRCLRP